MNASSPPASSPRIISGSVIRRKVRARLAPRFWAAS
jgi:hypothetical protein